MNRYILIISMLFICNTLISQNITKDTNSYRIVKLYRCKNVNIGGKKLKTGDVFKAKEPIEWKLADQQIVVEKLQINGSSSHEYLTLSCKGFQKFGYDKVKSLSDFLFQIKYTGHRGDNHNNGHYLYTDHYLRDTLWIKAYSEVEPDLETVAVWKNNKYEFTTKLDRTSDGKFYILSKSIYGTEKPQDIVIDIIERIKSLNLENTVYKDFPVIYIPTK